MNILWRKLIFIFFCFTGNVCVHGGWIYDFFNVPEENKTLTDDCNSLFSNKNCEKETTAHKITTKDVTKSTFTQANTESYDKLQTKKNLISTPILLVKPRNQTAKQDQEVVIQCRDEGNNRLEVFWSRRGYKTLPENAIHHNGRLTISNIKCEDSGDYVCRPVNKKYKMYASISTVEVICRTSPTTTATALAPYTPSPYNQVASLPCQNFTANGTCCHVVCKHCERTCQPDHFRCSNGDCIKNERFCDGEIDCPDGSDESACSSSWLPKIVMLPKMNVEIACLDPQNLYPLGSTLELQCAFVGHPVPTIKWKRYEGHVPSKCMQSSLNGRGTLKCPDFQQSDQGAYSCVAENSEGSSESQPRSIVKCNNVFSCDGFKVVDEHNIETCLECFCSGKTSKCERIKSTLVKNRLLFPTKIESVFVDSSGEVSFTKFSSDRIRYCSLSEDVLASYSFLKSYGRNLNVPRHNEKSDFFPDAPDVIIGDDKLILKYSFNKISYESQTSDIRFWEGIWHHNNGTVASRRDIMRVLSDLKFLMFRCEYRKNVTVNSSSDIILESSKIADSSSASYMEKCICPKGYDGLSCEKCSPGYYKKSDDTGFVCEEDSQPVLKPCDAGYTGDDCSTCDVMKGYYRNSKGVCVLSKCSMRGSLGLFPDKNDKCICKANVMGVYCDTCKPGSFYMDKTNPDGCKNCWCNYVSNKCASSQWYKTEISSTSLGGYNASTGRNFWLLPSEFSGNKLTSYGGFLRYTMKYRANMEKQPKSLSVEILSNGDTTVKYMHLNLDHSTSEMQKTWNVPIEEPNWRDNKDKVVSREQLLQVLSNVKAIYIESPYLIGSDEVSLVMAQLDVAEEISNDFSLQFSSYSLADKVERCSCPEGYAGLSCESCSEGYYKRKTSNSFECVECDCLHCDPELGCRDCKKGEYNNNLDPSDFPDCRKCPCNGNEDYCYKDVYDQVMCICKLNYSGLHCQYNFNENPSQSHLNVKISPIKVKNKKAGSVVTFYCSYDSTEYMQIVFKKTYKPSVDKTKLLEDVVHSTINMFETTSSANITIDLNLEFVECLVYNTARVKVGHVFAIIEGTVTDFVRPVIENCYDEPKHVKESEDLDLICEARGTPEPEIQWYLKSGSYRQKVDTVDGVHSIVSANLQQNGTVYLCVATNSVGDDKCSTHIVVQKRCDIISVRPEHANVYEGETIRFVCSTTNNSTVFWSRIGYPLLSKVYVDGEILEIKNVEKSDAGEYLCEAYSKDGLLTKTVSLTVNIKSEPPTAMIEDEDVTLRVGERYDIKCKSTGNPKPVIHWSKILDNLPANTFTTDMTLTISSATLEHTGIYECAAVSLLGNATSRINVRVIELPKIRIEPHSHNKVMKSESLKLRCVAEKGVPEPKISWLKMDDPFLNVQGETLRLTNSKAEDAGTYVCRAENEAGSAEEAAEVEVLVPPSVRLTPNGTWHAYIDDYVDLTCEAEGSPEPEIIWRRKTKTALSFIGREFDVKDLEKNSNKINVRVTSDLHSIICIAKSEAGEVSESLSIVLKKQRWTKPGPKSESIRAELGAKLDLIFDGLSGRIECRKDNSSLPGDVCYTGSGLEISSVQVHHRGTYRCQSKSNPLQEKSLVVAVTGFVHKFSEYLRSYLLLPLTVKSKEFRVEVTFKADRSSGTILMKKRNHEFVMCLTRNNTVNVKLYHSQQVLSLKSKNSLKLHVWYTVVFKAGSFGELFVYDENGKIMESQSSALNFDINWSTNQSDEIYVGGISNKKRFSFASLATRLTSFDGCISRLIINDHEYRMTEEGKYSREVSLCKMCSSLVNPCSDKGVCLDAPTQYGFACVCDEDEWSCPKSCKEQGCQMKNDLCKMINPCMNPENKCVHSQDRLSCRCASGFSGLTCEKEEKFDFRLEGNGFVKLSSSYLPRHSIFQPEVIAMKFAPSDSRGLLLWQGNTKNHLYLIISDGKLEYVYYNQGKNLTVRSDHRLTLNRTVYVVVSRRNSTVTMTLDDDATFEGSSIFTTNRVYGDIYIGGMPKEENHELYKWEFIYSVPGFKGCIHSVALGDERNLINIIEKDIVRRNIGKCDLNIPLSFDLTGDLQSESEEDSAESDDDQTEYQ